jgi:hypothetical protein
MDTYYVYEIVNADGNLIYIGKGKKTNSYDRMDYYKYESYKNGDRYIDRKLKKLVSFDINILKYFKSNTDACEEEIRLIEKYNPLCNLTKGGEGRNQPHSIEAKKKMSMTRLASKELREISVRNLKMATEANRGKRVCDGYPIIELYKTHSIREISKITNISFATIKAYLVEKGEYVYAKNKPIVSDETRKRISESCMGNTGNKPVIKYDLNGNQLATYDSITEAAVAFESKASPANISAACRGVQKTAYGFVWKFKIKKVQ